MIQFFLDSRWKCRSKFICITVFITDSFLVSTYSSCKNKHFLFSSLCLTSCSDFFPTVFFLSLLTLRLKKNLYGNELIQMTTKNWCLCFESYLSLMPFHMVFRLICTAFFSIANLCQQNYSFKFEEKKFFSLKK